MIIQLKVDSDRTYQLITRWWDKLISVNNACQMRPQRLEGDNVAVLSDRTDRTLAPVYTATVHMALATNCIRNDGLCATFPILDPSSQTVRELWNCSKYYFSEVTDWASASGLSKTKLRPTYKDIVTRVTRNHVYNAVFFSFATCTVARGNIVVRQSCAAKSRTNIAGVTKVQTLI